VTTSESRLLYVFVDIFASPLAFAGMLLPVPNAVHAESVALARLQKRRVRPSLLF
jgi:hypothetical protein